MFHAKVPSAQARRFSISRCLLHVCKSYLWSAVQQVQNLKEEWRTIGPTLRVVARLTHMQLRYSLSAASSGDERPDNAPFRTLLRSKHYPELQEDENARCMVTGVPSNAVIAQL